MQTIQQSKVQSQHFSAYGQSAKFMTVQLELTGLRVHSATWRHLFLQYWDFSSGWRVWLPMQRLQQSWVQTQHPPIQRNLTAGRWSVLNKLLQKSKWGYFYMAFQAKICTNWSEIWVQIWVQHKTRKKKKFSPFWAEIWTTGSDFNADLSHTNPE